MNVRYGYKLSHKVTIDWEMKTMLFTWYIYIHIYIYTKLDAYNTVLYLVYECTAEASMFIYLAIL